MFLCSEPSGPRQKRKNSEALDTKPGARTLNLPPTIWAAEHRTIDCRGERLA